MTTLFPPSPIPGSNAIGSFVIGVSPIGTIPPFLWQNSILSQYANSPIILALLQNFNDAMDLTESLETFYDKVWNILTAEGWGLDVWGRIVGIGRALTVDDEEYFGFSDALPTSSGFNQQPFYSGPPLTPNYLLSDGAYRQLILAKAAANICDGSIPAINRLLMGLFPGRGNCYVREGYTENNYFGFQSQGGATEGFNTSSFYSGQTLGRMTIEYVFEFALSPVERAIVENSGVLPTPTGVSASVVINP